MTKIDSLQYLRALAAIGVVVFHAGQRLGYSIMVAESGVDLFFILSGFLMVAITSPATDPYKFMKDRLLRIVPTYWMATTVIVAGALAGVFPAMQLTWWHVVSSYLFIASPSPSNGVMAPLLVPGWTLNCEIFFYIVYALGLAIAPARRLVFLGVVLGGLVGIGALSAPSDPVARFYTDPIFLEFLAGAVLALGWRRYGAPRRSLGYVLLTATIVGYAVAARANVDHPRLLMFGLPGLGLLAAAVTLGRQPGGVPKIPLLSLAGDASYSIYLWHTLVLAVLVKVALALHLPASVALPLVVMGATAAGVVAFHLIERPLQRWLRRPRRIHGIPVPAGI